MKKNKHNILKWLIYGIITFVLFIFQTTPGLFSINEIRPVLLYSVICAIAFFEAEVSSCVFAALAGLLIDYSATRIFGFFAFFLTIFALLISLLTRYLVRVNFVNFMIAVTSLIALITHLDFLFTYAIWNYNDSLLQYLNYTLPTAVYSIVVAPIIYYLIRKIAFKFNKPNDRQVKIT